MASTPKSVAAPTWRNSAAPSLIGSEAAGSARAEDALDHAIMARTCVGNPASSPIDLREVELAPGIITARGDSLDMPFRDQAPRVSVA